MKLLIVVVMFVVVSEVFAADVVWEIAPPFSLIPGNSGQESGKAAKDRMADSKEKQAQTQSNQQTADNMPALSTEPSADSPHAPSQQRKENIGPKEATSESDWRYRALWTAGAIVAIINAGFTVVMSILNYRRTTRRDTQDDQHRERTDRITQVKDRALLSLVRWELAPNNIDEMQTKDDVPDTVKYALVNIGNSSAILGGSYNERWVTDALPTIPNFQQKLSSKLKGRILSKGDPLPLSMDPLNTVDQKAVDREQKTLYAFVYVEYTDVFGDPYKITALMKYHYRESEFMGEEIPAPTSNA